MYQRNTYGVLSIKLNDIKNYLLYYSGYQAKSINVEGIFVVSKFRTNFGPNMETNG